MLMFWTLSIGFSAVMLGGLMSRNTNITALLTLGTKRFFSLYVLYLDGLQHESDTNKEAGIERVFRQFSVSYGAVLYI